jgi:hypothetical protein
MVGSTIMMIPGAWEARRRPVIAEDVVKIPAPSRVGNETLLPAAETGPRELPGWGRVSIFAGALLIAMWLAMTMFFERAIG